MAEGGGSVMAEKTVEAAEGVAEETSQGGVREVAVSAEVAARHPGACPGCASRSVVLEGQFRRGFHEVWQEGENGGYELGDGLERTVHAIVCPACRVRYVIEADALFELRKEIFFLRLELSRRNGMPMPEGESSRVH